ncbi:MAG: rhamnogalacturonan lyase [Phycisphaeraceae bacterium]|nr:MAG: rhamnogalacturonan lyase [Phycisphaeraceae bacterium]
MLPFLQVSFLATAPLSANAAEHLDRGFIAVPHDGTVYLAWRLLAADPDTIAFDVDRVAKGETTRLNEKPIADSTNLVDTAPIDGAAYSLTIHVAPKSTATAPLDFSKSFLSIPLRTPPGYHPNDASVGDLDGDGRYEVILKQEARTKDNSQRGATDPTLLQAYTLDGTFLWQIDLGPNIRSGAHYTPFQVFDYDGDGKAELICKTADGTTDAAGHVIGDPDARHANDQGYVLRGPEYLTVFNGLTGVAIDTVQYLPQRDPENHDDNPSPDRMKRFWGDAYGNRLDRFLAGTAYLDGQHPSAIFSRGYYTRTYIAAWDFDGSRLIPRWLFDSEDPACVGDHPRATDGREYKHPYSGQGFHALSIADVDHDGRDEIVFGAMTVDDTGKGLYTTGWGHGDALHVGEFDPDNPGLEIYGIQERFDAAGAHMQDAATGRILWTHPSVKAATSGGDKGEGPARGVCFDVDPRYPGSESWAAGAGMSGMWDAKGKLISETKPGSYNFCIYWDADPLQEILDRNHIDKWNWETGRLDRLFTAKGCHWNNGTKATPTLSADILGDWREEVLFATDDGSELRLFTTTIPSDRRITTLMQDRQYREAIAWQNTAYNQPPHPSFAITEDAP